MNTSEMESFLTFIRSLYPGETPVPLHAPRFLGREKEYLSECIDSTYVSYVGHFVTDFEGHIKNLTGARHAIAIVNGTAAIQMTLAGMGLEPGDEVITQALTFAATGAGIRHAGGIPVFVDVETSTLGMSPPALESYLKKNAINDSGRTIDRSTGRRIAAVMPMHTFGHLVHIVEIAKICEAFGIPLVEDAAEAIGSRMGDVHAGRFGFAAVLSFNGNKPVTTGGGGMILTDDDTLAGRIRHISTTAKRKHPWEFFHDEVGYNLRMPNVNAAIGCAQMEYFGQTLQNKRETAVRYAEFCSGAGIEFVKEPDGSRSNYWLNAIVLKSRAERDSFLEYSNENGVQTRPIWTLLTKLPPYADCPRDAVPQAEWLEDRIVNLPSSVRIH